MIKFMRSAVVVVACVAGFGAAAGFDQRVDQKTVSTYAAELFGQETELTYPDMTTGTGAAAVTSPMMPMVSLMLKADETVNLRSSVAEVTFTFANAKFVNNVPPSALVCQDTDADGGETALAADTPIAWTNTDATDCVVTRSADDGGRGDSTVTFIVTTDGSVVDTGPADNTDPTTAQRDAGFRLLLSVPQLRATGGVTVSSEILTTTGEFPPIVAPCPVSDNADTKTVDETDMCNQVVKVDKAVTAAGSGGGYKSVINLDDFMKLAVGADGKTVKAMVATYTFSVDNKAGTILGPDGTSLNEDAAATLSITVDGDLNEGDKIMVTGAESETLTVPAGGPPVSTRVTLSSSAAGLRVLTSSQTPIAVKYTLPVKLEYVPAGKANISHGAEIETTFDAKFTRVENIAIKPAPVLSTLLLKGVQMGDLRAYAIPASSNGKNDVANVRIRCEDGDRGDMKNKNMCRVFFECWNDDGMGGVGEAMESPLMEHQTIVANAEELERATGAEAMGRHSCRVLATGTATVQTLVRDGTTGTLVNNTVVGTAN